MRLYLSPPHMSGEEMRFVQDVFAQNWIAPVGPDVTAFESEICAITGTRHAVAVSSGTAALHLALIALGIGPGDEVLCSTFTFAASANPIVYQGATPVFVDSDTQSWNMDPELLREAIIDRIGRGKRPKAVVVVDLYGQCADYERIESVCREFDIALIEDAAEALGATYRGTSAGSFGTCGVFSFNGNKIITTSGGGMLVSDDAEIVEKARFLATQARDPAPHYEHSSIGYNYRLSNVLAGIGRGQLRVLGERVARKREIFAKYKESFENTEGISFIPHHPAGQSNAWLTCIVIDPQVTGATREEIRCALEREDIESRPLWKPMHLQPVFKDAPSYVNGTSEKLFANGLCLPSGTAMSTSDIARVVEVVRNALRPS